ncbi:DgyrCDS3503 [Dimorphilus gyrociliatus]|uniref:DgyrCDS3503 n=1 Tax=Dimorphilus gyrociliatus TaxID=2664684 RepID=A0A7I8VGH6_9ANNE|nr:DgyrCDS3503 [Dimorphilus gyrociliatus]
MAFPIPKPFKWSEEFEVFYKTLDEQHKGLFDAVFACAESNDDATFGTCVKKVKEHFADEEEIMKTSKYSGFDTHKQAHDEFVEKCSSLSAPLPDDKLVYMQQWLVDHIKGIDFKYKGQLQQ